MARVALLVGTGQYGEHFQALESIPKNLKALESVLKNPAMGGFDEVNVLYDPSHSEMSTEINTWLKARNKDDLLLLYLAGHGIKDSQRHLYFAASNTQKVKNELIDATALEARKVHEWLRFSPAKRQIIILDCCFSGAFGDLIAQDDGSVDLESEIGYDGRIILTSSSSTQYSFQQENRELSIYTHYLIEGIRTGAADRDQDGAISADELHEYASEKVQDESPAMTPKIIVGKDQGYKLRVANTPLSDPSVKYWKEVEKVVDKEQAAIIAPLAKRILKQWRIKLNISDEKALEIEQQVLEPYRQFLLKIQEYQEALEETLEVNNPLTEQDRHLLKEFQKLLGLKDEDVVEFQDSPLIVEEVKNTNWYTEEPDYLGLENLLRSEQWREADEATCVLMHRVIKNDRLSGGDLQSFPLEALQEIDRLWSSASNGKFGLTAQCRFWQEMKNNDASEGEFERELGWRVNLEGRQKLYKKLTFHLKNAPDAHLPAFFKSWGGWGKSWKSYLYERFLQTLPTVSSELIETSSRVLKSDEADIDSLDSIKLQSAKGINYEHLRNLLKAGEWKEADQETNRVMLQVRNRESEGYLEVKDLQEFPCEDLLTIDRLWVDASNGRFGFSVQKKIWEECGSPMSSGKEWDRFCVRVGWKNSDATAYVELKLKKNAFSPAGELPSLVGGLVFGVGLDGEGGIPFLAQRLVNCSITAFQPQNKN
jgi:hypothetical protein